MGQRASRIIVGLLIVVLFLATGCDLGMLEANTGSLAIRLGDFSRSLVWEPELDMDIASCTIKGTGPTANDAFEVSGHTEGLFTKDGLAVGSWTITVDGYNSDSEKIATVQATATVTRNATTPVTVVLRPVEGTGTLSVAMSWTDSQGVLASPSAVVVIRDEQGADIQDISDPVALTINGQTAAAEVTDLPTGWYEVTVSLRDGNSNAWQGVFALRVVKDQTTTGTVVIDEAQIQIGSGAGTVAITIQEDMDDPLSVGFSGMPDSVEAGTEVTLSSTGTYSGDVQYRWYVNGVRQADQTESSFSHTFNAAGTHMVSLLVLDGGALGGYGESLLVREAGVDPVGQPDFPESGSFTLKQTTSSDTVSIRVPNEQYLGSIQLFAHETDLGSVIIHPEYIFATLLLNSGIKTSMQEMSEHFLETRSFLFHATEIDKNSESWDLDIDQLDLYVLAGTKRLEEVIRTFQGDAIFGYISSKIMLTGASRKNYTDNRKINEILNMSLSLSSFSASPFSGWFSGKVQYTADINYFYDGNGNRHNLPVRLTFSIPKISCDLSEIDSNVIRTKLFVPFDRINPVFDYDVIHHELDDIWKTWSDFAEEPYLRIKLELGNQNGNTTTVQVWEEQQALELLIPLLYTLYQNAF